MLAEHHARGFAGFLPKPYTAEEIVGAVREALATRR